MCVGDREKRELEKKSGGWGKKAGMGDGWGGEWERGHRKNPMRGGRGVEKNESVGRGVGKWRQTPPPAFFNRTALTKNDNFFIDTYFGHVDKRLMFGKK